MRRETQIELGREIVHLLKQQTTPMADEVFINDPAVYTNAVQHEQELPIFFRRQPLVLGASCQLAAAGDYFTDDNTGVPLLVVRGADQVVRTFANICSHRGSRIVLDQGGCGARAFTCPYHAWVYGTEGSLRAIPGDGFGGVDPATLGLVAFPTVERAGLIWVLPTPIDETPEQAANENDVSENDAFADVVDTHLGPELLADLASFGLGSFHHYDTRRLERRLNWKLTMDTFFESYHFRQLHKNTIAPLLHSDLAPVRHYGHNHLLVGVRKTANTLIDLPEDSWDIPAQTALVYLLFPNTIFIMQRDHVEIFRVFPGPTVADSVIEISFFVPDDPADTPDPAAARRHWDVNFDLLVETADTEDFTNGATIQRSFESGVARDVRYGRNEPLMQSWHRSLRQVAATDSAS